MTNQILQTLSNEWIIYCASYAKTLSLEKACVASGLSVSYARQHSRNKLVMLGIAKNLRTIVEASNVSATDVLNHLADMMESDVGDLYDSLGNFLPLKQWPKIWRQMVSSLEVYETGVPHKVKFVDKLKVIELVGKHVNVAAFEERHKHIHDVSDRLAERIGKARSRAMLNSPVLIEDGEVVDERG